MGRALLITVTGMIVVFGLVQSIALNRQIEMFERSNRLATSMQARNIATSLIDLTIHELSLNLNYRTSFDLENYLGGSGAVLVEDFVDDPSLSDFDVRLTATASYDDFEHTVQVMVRRNGFSRYAYFSELEGTVWFITADSIKGPLHSNSQLRIWGTPVFFSRVTSPFDWYSGSASTDPQFLGGTNFEADAIPMPSDLSEVVAAADSAVGGFQQYEEEVRFILNSDGTVTVSNNPGSGWTFLETLTLADGAGVLSSTDHIHIAGVLNGQLTVHSQNNIYIIGDIVYNDDPRINPASEDMLGLIAEDNIIVTNTAHTYSGTSDLTAHGSYMALNTSFTVQDYNSGGPKGNLFTLGGLIQYQRGPVATGSFNTTTGVVTITNGFNKAYDYDSRFLARRPPLFPLQNKYDVVAWRE